MHFAAISIVAKIVTLLDDLSRKSRAGVPANCPFTGGKIYWLELDLMTVY